MNRRKGPGECRGLQLSKSGGITPAEEGAENAFPCRVRQVVEDVSAIELALVPEGAEEGSAVLWMEAGRSVLAGTEGGERIWVSLPPEDILLLRE